MFWYSQDTPSKIFNSIPNNTAGKLLTADSHTSRNTFLEKTDFLTALTNPSERIVQPSFEGKVPRTPDEFAEWWRTSELRARLLQDISAFEEQYPLGGEEVEKLAATRKAERASFTYVSALEPSRDDLACCCVME